MGLFNFNFYLKKKRVQVKKSVTKLQWYGKRFFMNFSVFVWRFQESGSKTTKFPKILSFLDHPNVLEFKAPVYMDNYVVMHLQGPKAHEISHEMKILLKSSKAWKKAQTLFSSSVAPNSILKINTLPYSAKRAFKNRIKN